MEIPNFGVKIAHIPNTEEGRSLMARLQTENRVFDQSNGYMVVDGKQVPCASYLYIEGLDPYIEQNGDKPVQVKQTGKKLSK